MDKNRQAVFDPPAFMTDFTPAQRQTWDRLVTAFFDSSLKELRKDVTKAQGNPAHLIPQFFDPTSTDISDMIVQPIMWNAFPKELLVRFGREHALIEADRLWPLTAYGPQIREYYDSETPGAFISASSVLSDTFYRPQVEYCEWHVTQHPKTNQITCVTFTSEPPEYWQAMFGDRFNPDEGEQDVLFPDGREQVLARYREMVSPDVQLEDLIAPMTIELGSELLVKKGSYNPYNKWNTTHGIVHLCAPPNSLSAEIQLGAEATLRRVDGSGDPITNPDALICCAAFGGVNRNSDPTIGSTVNALARLGAMVTLVNPVGLYMDHIDLSGWETPDHSEAQRYVTIARGLPGMIERLVVEVPLERGFTVSDIRIGGVPIAYGGQIAECITVKLVGGARQIGSVKDNVLLRCIQRCYLDPTNASELAHQKIALPLPAGTVAAFYAARFPFQTESQVEQVTGKRKLKRMSRRIPLDHDAIGKMGND